MQQTAAAEAALYAVDARRCRCRRRNSKNGAGRVPLCGLNTARSFTSRIFTNQLSYTWATVPPGTMRVPPGTMRVPPGTMRVPPGSNSMTARISRRRPHPRVPRQAPNSLIARIPRRSPVPRVPSPAPNSLTSNISRRRPHPRVPSPAPNSLTARISRRRPHTPGN